MFTPARNHALPVPVPRHSLQHCDDVAHPLCLAGGRDRDRGVAEVQSRRRGGGGGAAGGPVDFGDVHGLGVLEGEGGAGGGQSARVAQVS